MASRMPISVRCLEVDFHALVHHCGLSVEVHRDLFEKVLDELHHPDIVLVGHIDFHTCKLRVVGLVHALVAEILGELIHAVIASHDESLQIKLIGNTQIQRDVQCIVMCDERSCRSAARYRLENRGLHLQTACIVEILTHRSDNLGPLDESVLYLRVYDEVHISLSVSELRIGERVVHLAVSLLHDRKNFQ